MNRLVAFALMISSVSVFAPSLKADDEVTYPGPVSELSHDAEFIATLLMDPAIQALGCIKKLRSPQNETSATPLHVMHITAQRIGPEETNYRIEVKQLVGGDLFSHKKVLVIDRTFDNDGKVQYACKVESQEPAESLTAPAAPGT